MLSRREGPARPWPLYLLALLTAGVVAFAITQIGPPTSSARTSRQVVTAQDGVVQSTVSGTGNVTAATDVSVNFQTSGTIATVLVHQGQHVIEGQLMATLDPTAAQLTVDQAQEQLTAAQDQLTALQNGTSTGSGSATGGASSGTGSASSASTTVAPATPEFVSATVTTPTTPPKRKSRTGPGTTTTPTTPTPTTTTPTRTTTTPTRTTSTPERTTSTPARTTTTPTTTTTTPSPAGLASAQASIYSAQANLRTAQQNLAKTKLYAPATGTIVSLSSLTVGDSVSAGSTGTSSAGGSGSGSGATGSGSSTAGGLGSGGSSTSASASSGSSSAFAEIVDASSMTMTVSFSESDITKVHVGQPATVTIDALSGVELGAHVSAIATVGTTSSSVVSYAATLTLDQLDPRVKPGMSASASVIVGQAQGVTVPTQAISGTGTLATVNMLRNGQTVSQPVVVGLRGDSRAQIVSGLDAGQQLVITVTLPSIGASSTGTGTLGSRLGGGGLGGLGGGGGAFLRGAAGGGAFRGGGG